MQAVLDTPNHTLDNLTRLFALEEPNLLRLPQAAPESYLIQQIRERAYHESEDSLRSVCDVWLNGKLHLKHRGSHYPISRTMGVDPANGPDAYRKNPTTVSILSTLSKTERFGAPSVFVCVQRRYYFPTGFYSLVTVTRSSSQLVMVSRNSGISTGSSASYSLRPPVSASWKR